MSTTGGFYEWVAPAQLTEPHSRTVEVFRDCWWSTDRQGRVCLYRWGRGNREISPQCNADRAVARRVSPPGAVGTVLLPIAFVPHRCGR